MNTYLNYLIEANLGLLVFFVVYTLILRRETNFHIKRLFLLGGVTLSLLLPCIHFEMKTQLIPAVSNAIPTYWLPEVTLGNKTANAEGIDGWQIASYTYLGGLLIFALQFLVQIAKLFAVMRKSETVYSGDFRIALSNKNQSTFSFFKFIFIGQADQLSEEEKKQIIQHESVHALQWHSIDVVLVTILGIVFWFNPFIRIYKNTLVELHEFEADARVAESSGTNEYCRLLAKVALLSADFTLANHFNNSLTLKRISMLKSIKQKLKIWKVVAILATVPLLFCIISCQDQLIQDRLVNDNLPVEAKNRFARFQQTHAGETFIVEYNREGNRLLTELENKYGEATHIELFMLKDGRKARNFSMIQYNSTTSPSATASNPGDEIFTVVDQAPAYYENGFQGLIHFISNGLKYPKDARMSGKEGTVFIQFIVEKDGTVSEATVLKSVEESLDEEALRISKQTKWIPGKQNGEIVRVRFVLPIKYKL